MKKIDKSDIHLNKYVNVFKYIVFIIAFVMVGMVKGMKVEAADCLVEWSSAPSQATADCNSDATWTHVTKKEIGIPVYIYGKGSYYAGYSISFKICKYSAPDDNCQFFTIVNGSASTKVDAVHFIMHNDGTVEWKYETSKGWSNNGVMYQYTSTSYTNFLNSYEGSIYQTGGFRIELLVNIACSRCDGKKG